MSGSSIALNPPWTAVGPQQVQTANFGLITGRVTSVAVDTTDPTGNTVYVGTASGGVWKSTNAAGSPARVSFIPRTDGLPGMDYNTSQQNSLSIGALSVQPGQGNVILAGTGDPNDGLDSAYGTGILRSEDGGNTWAQIPQSSDPPPGQPFSFFGLSFTGFAWSTASPNLVVAAVASSYEGAVLNAGSQGNSRMGLYYSQDAGKSWQLATIEDGPYQKLQAPNMYYSPSFDGNAATAVVWNPVRRMFIAAVRYHGYYQSSDGVTWTRMQHQPGAGFTARTCPANPGSPGSTNCPIFRGALAVEPVTGDTFAISTDLNNADQGLFQDICAAVNGACGSVTVLFGQQLSTAPLEASGGSTAIPQADYDLWLRAVPQGGDTLLYAGTKDVYRCSLAAGCIWRNTTHVDTCVAPAGVAAAQHAVDWVPGTGTLFFGNDGGLWRTTDYINQQPAACSSDDGSHFDNLNGGLGALMKVTSIAQVPSDSQSLLAAAGQSGTIAKTLGATTWAQEAANAGGYVAIDPLNSRTWYATAGPGVAISRCTLGAQCTAADFMPAIGNAQVGNDGTALYLPAAWMLDPQDPTTMLVGTCRVWRGPAGGGTGWSSANAISPMLDGDNAPSCQGGPGGFGGNAQIRSLAASGPISGRAAGVEKLYAGMAGSFDGGTTAAGHLYTAVFDPNTMISPAWTDLYHSPVSNDPNNGGQFNPGGFAISSIAVDPHDITGQTVYAAVAGFGGDGLTEQVSEPLIYASTDGGRHWTNITSNLPDIPVNSLAVDPNTIGVLYAGTDAGVFVTAAAAQCGPRVNCWNLYGVGLPAAPVLEVLPYTGSGETVLRAATYGRGVWQTGLASASANQGGTTSAVANPTALAFSPIPVGTTSSYQSTTVTNTGGSDLQIGPITATTDFLEQNNCPASLSSGAACTVNVAYAPTAIGARAGMLTMGTNTAGGQLAVALSGTGTAAGAVVLTPSNLNFGSALVGSHTQPQYLTIANNGVVAVSLGVPSVTGSFVLTATTCTGTLSANASCTVGIAFGPTAEGAALGSFSITDDAGTQTAPLLGTGTTGATDNLAPLALTFAPQTVNTASTPQQVTLTNNGDTALTLIQASISGDFAVADLCGASLAPHTTCAVAVTFSPRNVGSETGMLTIQDALSTQTVPLQGNGTAPSGGSGGGTGGGGTSGGISLSPSALDFGEEGVGRTSAGKLLTLTNNGTGTVGGVAVQATGDFTTGDDTCTTPLAPGTACTVLVSFTPSQTGQRSGTFTLTSGDLPGPMVANLNGMGVDFQLAVVGSPSVTVVGGSKASYTLQVTSLGGASGTLAVACTGAPASATCSISPSPAPLVPGATTTLLVTITTAGQSTAAVRDIPGMWAVSIALLLPAGWGLRKHRKAVCLVLLACVSLATVGCGLTITGGKKTSPGGTGGTGSVGSYTLTVTASAPDVQHSVNLSLNVE